MSGSLCPERRELSSGTAGGCVWPVTDDIAQETVYRCGPAIAKCVTEEATEPRFTHGKRGCRNGPRSRSAGHTQDAPRALPGDELVRSSQSPAR